MYKKIWNEANNDELKYENTIVRTIIESLQLNNYPSITLFAKRKLGCLDDVAMLTDIKRNWQCFKLFIFVLKYDFIALCYHVNVRLIKLGYTF